MYAPEQATRLMLTQQAMRLAVHYNDADSAKMLRDTPNYEELQRNQVLGNWRNGGRKRRFNLCGATHVWGVAAQSGKWRCQKPETRGSEQGCSQSIELLFLDSIESWLSRHAATGGGHPS